MPNLSPSGEPHPSSQAPPPSERRSPSLTPTPRLGHLGMFLQLPGHFNLHLQEMTPQEFRAPSSHVIQANGRVPFTQTDGQRQVVWPLARAQSRSHASGHRPRLFSLFIGSQCKPHALLYRRPRPATSAICQGPLRPTFRGLPLAPRCRPLFRAFRVQPAFHASRAVYLQVGRSWKVTGRLPKVHHLGPLPKQVPPLVLTPGPAS